MQASEPAGEILKRAFLSLREGSHGIFKDHEDDASQLNRLILCY